MDRVASPLETKILLRLWQYTGIAKITPHHGQYRLQLRRPLAVATHHRAQAFLCHAAYLKSAVFQAVDGCIVGVPTFRLTAAGARFYAARSVEPDTHSLRPSLAPLIEEAVA